MKTILIKIYSNIELFTLQIVEKVANFIHIDISDDMQKELQRILRFLIVGTANTSLSYVIYSSVIIMGGHYFGASVASFTVGVLNAFYWNNSVIFKNIKTKTFTMSSAFIKTIIGYVSTGFIFPIMLLHIWVDILNINELIAPLFNVCIVVPTNYLFNRFWIYK